MNLRTYTTSTLKFVSILVHLPKKPLNPYNLCISETLEYGMLNENAARGVTWTCCEVVRNSQVSFQHARESIRLVLYYLSSSVWASVKLKLQCLSWLCRHLEASEIPQQILTTQFETSSVLWCRSSYLLCHHRRPSLTSHTQGSRTHIWQVFEQPQAECTESSENGIMCAILSINAVSYWYN